jgi:hypothetical protein
MTACLFSIEYDGILTSWKLFYENGKRIYDGDKHDRLIKTIDTLLGPYADEVALEFAKEAFGDSELGLSIGFMFNETFSADTRYPELRNVFTRIWHEYAHDYGSDGLLNDFWETIYSIYISTKDKKAEGKEVPSWWDLKVDEELLRDAPELEWVRWEHVRSMMVEPAKGDDQLGDVQKFVSIFPEFASACSMITTLQFAMSASPSAFNAFSRLFDEATGPGFEDMSPRGKKMFADAFRVSFANNLAHLKALYNDRIKTEGNSVAKDILFTSYRPKQVKGDGGDNNGGSTPPTSPSTPSTPSTPPVVSGGSVSNAASIGCRSPATVLSPMVGSSRPSSNILHGGQYLMMTKAPVLTSARI